MDKKVIYVTPNVEALELKTEGVLCASQSDGSIDKLYEKYDWSDDLWN